MMGADKEFVLAHWGEGLDEDYTDDHQFFFIADSGVNFDSWSSAAEFTRERLKDIAALELAVETAFCPDSENNHCATCELTMPLRKLAIAALEKLKMGMR